METKNFVNRNDYKLLIQKPYQLVTYDKDNLEHVAFINKFMIDSEIAKWLGDIVFFERLCWQTQGAYMLKYENDYIGRLGFYYLPYNFKKTYEEFLSISYGLLEKYRNLGHMTAVLKQVINNLQQIGETKLLLEIVTSILENGIKVKEGNLISKMLAEKLGFKEYSLEKTNYSQKTAYIYRTNL